MDKNKIIIILALFSLFLFNANNIIASGTAYTDITGTTHYSDGSTSYVDITGTTHYSNGCSSYTDITGTTHYSGGVGCGGSSYNDITGTTHYNFDNNTNGTAYTDITGTTHYNDNKGTSGSSYTDITGTTHYNGDIFIAHNCPVNSSFDSVSSNCKCSYGYVVSGSSCVDANNYCSSQLGLMSRYNSLSNKCECMSGYEFNGSSCVYKNTDYLNIPTYSSPPISAFTPIIPIKTNDQICQDSFGLNVNWDGTKASNGNLNCNCKTGFIWKDSNKTSCVSVPIVPAKTNDQVCSDSYLNSYFNGVLNDKGGPTCDCKTGYQWNSGKTACVVNAPTLTPAQIQTLPGIFANSVQKVNPTNNGYSVKAGDTLYVLYGDNWRILSGYTGDPTQLKVGTILNFLPN